MCCGNSRTPFRPGTPASPAPSHVPSGATFENIGRTGLTVVGPVTGRRYHFAGTGARVTVDPRDRASVSTLSALRPVRPPSFRR